MAESFFKSLKTELIYGNKLISKQQMKLEIFEYIEIRYNRKRRHSALNYATIEEFNNQINYKKCSLTYIAGFICTSKNYSIDKSRDGLQDCYQKRTIKNKLKKFYFYLTLMLIYVLLRRLLKAELRFLQCQ